MGYLEIFRNSKSSLNIILQNCKTVLFCVHRLFDCLALFSVCILQFGSEQYWLIHILSQCFSCVSNSFGSVWIPQCFLFYPGYIRAYSPSQLKPNEPVRPQHVVLNRKTPVIRPMRGIFSEPLWNVLYMTHRAQHLLHIAEWHHNRLKHSIL